MENSLKIIADRMSELVRMMRNMDFETVPYVNSEDVDAVFNSARELFICMESELSCLAENLDQKVNVH
jgi:hypothetical protein